MVQANVHILPEIPMACLKKNQNLSVALGNIGSGKMLVHGRNIKLNVLPVPKRTALVAEELRSNEDS